MEKADQMGFSPPIPPFYVSCPSWKNMSGIKKKKGTEKKQLVICLSVKDNKMAPYTDLTSSYPLPYSSLPEWLGGYSASCGRHRERNSLLR